ncbi:lipoyl(octanoyl) transferase LipB [Candidatus Pelagibacter communis]|uniref:lipoyl(octanoyl) transferase LipB n=1 Tax=Pelagibacter ubique TaxID=198252 RepID=UPI001C52ADDA
MLMEIKISKKPVKYEKAIEFLDERVHQVYENINDELIWFLEHKSVYTSGVNFNQKDVLDKKIKIIKTNRGGKITWHGPGQLICYFVLDISKRKKDIRKFITAIENSIIETLKNFKINSFSDRKNIGIWVLDKKEEKKIAAIGFRVKKWIAFHGFSLNLSNNLNNYKKIVPCGISDKGISKVDSFKKISKSKVINELKINLIKNLRY